LPLLSWFTPLFAEIDTVFLCFIDAAFAVRCCCHGCLPEFSCCLVTPAFSIAERLPWRYCLSSLSLCIFASGFQVIGCFTLFASLPCRCHGFEFSHYLFSAFCFADVSLMLSPPRYYFFISSDAAVSSLIFALMLIALYFSLS